MLIFLIIAGVIIFAVSTYSAPVVVVDDSELGIPSPVINQVEPSTTVTPVMKDTAIPVEKTPERVYQPALNGNVLIKTPTPVERPVSTFPEGNIKSIGDLNAWV